MMEQKRAFKGEDVLRFSRHALRQIPGKVLIIWDGSPIHSGQAIKDFLASWAAKNRLLLEQLPFSTPRISTPMRESLKAPEVRGTQENVCCQSLSMLEEELRKAKERLRHKKHV